MSIVASCICCSCSSLSSVLLVERCLVLVVVGRLPTHFLSPAIHIAWDHGVVVCHFPPPSTTLSENMHVGNGVWRQVMLVADCTTLEKSAAFRQTFLQTYTYASSPKALMKTARNRKTQIVDRKWILHLWDLLSFTKSQTFVEGRQAFENCYLANSRHRRICVTLCKSMCGQYIWYDCSMLLHYGV